MLDCMMVLVQFSYQSYERESVVAGRGVHMVYNSRAELPHYSAVGVGSSIKRALRSWPATGARAQPPARARLQSEMSWRPRFPCSAGLPAEEESRPGDPSAPRTGSVALCSPLLSGEAILSSEK
jgi:hypothetical protein